MPSRTIFAGAIAAVAPPTMEIRHSQIPTRVGIILLPLLLSAAARAEAPAALAAATETSPSNDECLGCHGNELDRSEGRPIPALGEAFAESVHGAINLACVDCHVDLQGKDLPHEEKLAKAVCSTCHEDAVKAYDQSVHADSRRKSGDSLAAGCSDCHGVHDIRGSQDPKSKTYHFNLQATCSHCHADEAVIAKAKIKAGNVTAHFQDGIHGQALNKSGLVVAPNCATCHGNHEIRRASDDKSRVNRANVPKTCGSCHEGIRAIYETSVHAAAVREGNPQAAICIDCHIAHDTKAVDAAWRLELVKERGTCHKESMRTFRDTFHGKVSMLGFSRAATCADCHGSHGILPKKDPQSMVSDARRAQTCSKCHPGASEKFSRYDPHADAHDRERNPVLAFVTMAMRLLLISVLAFFGLHAMLWLGRSLVSMRKLRAKEGSKEGSMAASVLGDSAASDTSAPSAATASPDPAAKGFVLRFQRTDRMLHLLLMASLLTLALTGMPLLSPEAPWATTLAKLLGGYRVTGVLHRIAAITLMLVFLTHLVRLAHRLLVRKDYGILWGPRSLLPRLIDLVQLLQHIRWFVGLGPRPRFDRYAYWEKFAYWAVFGNLAIMGASGLMLWFPAFFARIVPGWVFNIALVVHGEKALITMVLIFTVHFFHGSLRPAKFPLDRAHARLVSEDRLADAMTDSPAQDLSNWGRLVGTIAAFIGLTIATLAIYTLLR